MSGDRIVHGWMSENERMALRRWAFGLKVLEIGCYEGLSTMQLAMTADHVTTVDTFDGRATPAERDTEEAFHLNMKSCGATSKVFAIKGESGKVLPKLEKSFELIFVDGDHSPEGVRSDATLSRQILKEGGALAFHDYTYEHPGVIRIVDELIEGGMYLAEKTDSLVVLKEGPKPKPPRKRLAILYPSYDGWYMHGGITPSRCYDHTIVKNGSSIITTTFNKLLVEVMNSDDTFTHLLMLHADIVPDMFFADKLVEELEVNDLDMLSAVVPIKNERGTTSTGVEVIGTQWAVRRLCMNEIYGWDLPPTFKAEDIPGRQVDQGLLLNSGCWVMRWDRPWIKGLHFRQHDRIVWSLSEQKYGTESASEDWDWSRQLLNRGCRLGATTKVKLHHQDPKYHNRGPWGTWECDEDFFREEKVIDTYEAKQEAAV
jgi:hypothetical protein